MLGPRFYRIVNRIGLVNFTALFILGHYADNTQLVLISLGFLLITIYNLVTEKR